MRGTFLRGSRRRREPAGWYNPAMVDPSTFERYVQDALEHLYDPAYLLAHPLAGLLVPRGSVEPPGHALHRVLREAIGHLKPPPDAPAHSPAWRSYRYLSLRYVEMLTIGQVASELGISPRQARRDHHDAVSAITAILRERLRQTAGPREEEESTESGAEGQLLAAEVGKMGASAPTTATDVKRIVESVVATASALAATKGVELGVELPANLPPVLVDRTALRQMLLELLLDAIDRRPGGRVELGAALAQDRVRLWVTGQPLVGEPGAAEGAKVGERSRLAVSRRLAELQGVGLEVAGVDGGQTVSLALPTVEAPVVLVVDDNADVLHLFRHYLEGTYDVLEATSGEQALQLARQFRPRIITLDVMMPAQDGWEILQILKHDPATATIPIIVCSVLRERELALSLGAADFLAKPITGRALVSALQRCRPAS